MHRWIFLVNIYIELQDIVKYMNAYNLNALFIIFLHFFEFSKCIYPSELCF
jgi:hypothetical protein